MEKESLMKTESEEEDDLRPEYDFSQMKGCVRGKYVERYREGTNVVLLDPDVAAAFPDAKAVNDALRLLLREKGRRSLQNRERTGVPARAARLGWWMRPDQRINLSVSIPSLPLRVLYRTLVDYRRVQMLTVSGERIIVTDGRYVTSLS